jgi:hypothetical protein
LTSKLPSIIYSIYIYSICFLSCDMIWLIICVSNPQVSKSPKAWLTTWHSQGKPYRLRAWAKLRIWCSCSLDSSFLASSSVKDWITSTPSRHQSMRKYEAGMVPTPACTDTFTWVTEVIWDCCKSRGGL